jgi:hypothetical protein
MKYFIHLLTVHWRERRNYPCRAKYKRIEREMWSWEKNRKKAKP